MLMTHYNIIILESNLNTETWFKTFTGEAFEAAVLDSCANTCILKNMDHLLYQMFKLSRKKTKLKIVFWKYFSIWRW